VSATSFRSSRRARPDSGPLLRGLAAVLWGALITLIVGNPSGALAWLARGAAALEPLGAVPLVGAGFALAAVLARLGWRRLARDGFLGLDPLGPAALGALAGAVGLFGTAAFLQGSPGGLVCAALGAVGLCAALLRHLRTRAY
jgi:hypothetical protein